MSLCCLLVGKVVPVGVDPPEKGVSDTEGMSREKVVCTSKRGTAGSKVEVFLPLRDMVGGSENLLSLSEGSEAGKVEF